MKKLRLKAQELGASEILTRKQLMNVLGGDGPKPTTAKCPACTSSDNCKSADCPTCGADGKGGGLCQAF